MEQLRGSFITTERPYREGAVEAFVQPVGVKSVKKATLTITALGVYEAELDGEKIGDALFTPGFTYYPKEVQVQTYDITGRIKKDSVLRVYLGQGWYCGRFGFENKVQIYGERPAVSWVLDVEEVAGNTVTFTSRDASVAAEESPYEYAGLYDGEIYRADGGGQPVFPPVPYTGPLPEVFDETLVFTRLREEMPVQSVTERDGVTILDFGQNFAGVIEIDPAKMESDTLKLRHGEILTPDGGLYTANLRKAKAETVYTKGKSLKKYRPRFTYMGFRYAELSGVPYVPGLLTAYAVYSDMERTGRFSCENQDIKRLYENQIWGQKSNYVEVPTDCPQRDERMGYTGDGHVFARAGMYNFDTRLFWKKFLRDIRCSQQDNREGYVAPKIPASGPEGVGFMSMLGWGSAVTIVPQALYEQYGDDSFLREQYDSMKAHVDCEIRHMGSPAVPGIPAVPDLWIGPSLGDWLAPGLSRNYMAIHNGPVSDAFIVNDLRILSEAAQRFGFSEDAQRYADQLEKTRAAFLSAFVNGDGSMKDDYQGAYVMALQYVIPKGELWEKVFQRLTEQLRSEGMKTGFFATQHLLPLLADHGEARLAYDLLLQENCPGWLYQVKQGATTIWERWDALRPDGTVNEEKMDDGENMVSFNHYAFGSVGEFYYRYILGIQPLEPGYRKIKIAPVMDGRLGEVSGSYLSAAGEIKVSWAVKGSGYKLSITTPAEAELSLPGGEKRLLAAGSHEFSGGLV